MRCPFLPAAALILLVFVPAMPHAGGPPVFWVGPAAPCNFNTLQIAIDAVPNGATIRLANNQAYNNINVAVVNKSLVIEGGWADCAGTVSSQRAVLVGAPAVIQPVLRVESPAVAREVVLRRLEIRGGQRSGIEQIGHVSLRLDTSIVDGNQGSNGGGIRVLGVSPEATELRLVQSIVGNASALPVPSNQATGFGGGIHCQDAEVSFRAAVVRNNRADLAGGGLHLDGCLVTTGLNVFTFPDIGRTSFLIAANVSGSSGGGIHATGGSELYLGSATTPLFAISGNQANRGGGVHMTGAGTSLTAGGLSINDNTATGSNGGAGYLADGASLSMGRDQPVGPGIESAGGTAADERGALVLTRCAQAIECSEVNFNSADTSTGGAFFVSDASLSLQGTVLAGNFAGNGSIVLATSGATARLQNVLIRANDSDGGDVLRVINGSTVVLKASTLAGNATGNALIRLFSAGGGNELTLDNSIIWQPDTTVLAATGVDVVTSSCMNAHESTSIAALVHEPGFVSTVAGNYRLLSSSANIDACADPFFGVPTDDILGRPRPVDLAPANGAGHYDRGAYELGDAIFEFDFEL